jgi:hypothetical protein
MDSKSDIQYQTPYLESLGPKVFKILGFSEFWIFMQRNFNTDKINDIYYMLRYALCTIHNFFWWEIKKPLKSEAVSSSLFRIHAKVHNLCHHLTKQVQISKLPSNKLTSMNNGRWFLDASVYLLSCAFMSQSTLDSLWL